MRPSSLVSSPFFIIFHLCDFNEWCLPQGDEVLVQLELMQFRGLFFEKHKTVSIHLGKKVNMYNYSLKMTNTTKFRKINFSAWGWAKSGVQREWPGVWGLLAERAHPLNTSLCGVNCLCACACVCILCHPFPSVIDIIFPRFCADGRILVALTRKRKTNQLWITTANTAL